MIEIHRNREDATAQAGSTGGCACGEHDGEMPELDAQAIPHAVRHAAIFGALDALRPGNALVLLAPHDPVPLLTPPRDRRPAEFTSTYLESGPDRWRIALVRSA